MRGSKWRHAGNRKFVKEKKQNMYDNKLMKHFLLLTALAILSACSGNDAGAPDTEPTVNKELPADKQTNNYWENIIRAQTKESHVVVLGKVSGVSAKKKKSGVGDEYIISRIDIKIAQTIKGRPTNVLHFYCLGGIVDDILFSTSIAPLFSKGEDVIVFLINVNGDLQIPLGWQAAKLQIDRINRIQPGNLPISEVLKWTTEVGAE